MDSDRFKRLDSIFREALHVEPAERDAYIVDACDGNVALADEARVLLAEDAANRDALATAALDANRWSEALEEVAERAANEQWIAPDAIPGYRILRRIGAGGMGVVYEAEQESPRRLVAIKVLRHAVPSGEAARRFALEADVLGQLQHPGIAQIYGAGSFEGPAGLQPYLAMELIRGAPLNKSDRVRELPLHAKLELIAAIADAVQHAHHRGIIHRDLKPANILVSSEENSTTAADGRVALRSSADGGAVRPRVLDFGIARMTRGVGEARTLETASGRVEGELVGTLAYMSPEQAGSGHDAVDVRSDVYALGVVAFETLAERLPYDVSECCPLNAARMIRETAPRLLGTLDHRLRGDVEAIVAKALAKDREQRYQSASELAADIRRHLRDEPITARGRSVIGHLHRIVRRERAASAMIATMTLLLGVAAIMVAQTLSVSRHERDDVVRHAAIADALRTFFDDDLFGAAGVQLARGTPMTLLDAVDLASEAVNAGLLADRPAVEAAMHATIGRAYRRLGQHDVAENHLLLALASHRQLLGDAHPDTVSCQRELMELRADLGGEVSEPAEAAQE